MSLACIPPIPHGVMTMLTFRTLGLAYGLAAAFLLSGCAGTVKGMREVPAAEASFSPAPGEAMVVFMRPSGLGYAIQSSVFEIVDDNPKLVGIVAAKKKVAYSLPPGKHLFMVIGESADFMGADLAEGRTYYALVTPRMGWWNARFSLRPIPKAELASEEFKDWLEECIWVAKTPESDHWEKEHHQSIVEKQKDDYSEWQRKDDLKKPWLHPDDGKPMAP